MNVWRKISDKQPDTGKNVLVSFKGTGNVFVSYMSDDSEYGLVWVDFEDYHSVNLDDLWMEIPVLPIKE